MIYKRAHNQGTESWLIIRFDLSGKHREHQSIQSEIVWDLYLKVFVHKTSNIKFVASIRYKWKRRLVKFYPKIFMVLVWPWNIQVTLFKSAKSNQRDKKIEFGLTQGLRIDISLRTEDKWISLTQYPLVEGNQGMWVWKY